MSERQRRVVVLVILLAGSLWLVGTKRGPAAAARATAPQAKPASTYADAENEPPWAKKATAATPLVKFTQQHPSPVGRQIGAALTAGQAVVLVGLPAGRPDRALLGWIGECSDYCRQLAQRVDLDVKDPSEQGLLTFLGAAGSEPPVLIGIAPSGEVRQTITAPLQRKTVIGLFAAVTGSCGVECKDGCP